jgi:putative transport protein
MDWFQNFLVRYPEFTLFLVIAAGYWVGALKVGGFSLGPVTGSLLAGIVVGHFVEVPVGGLAKSFLFLLFLFGIGYSVGPQFLRALKRDGLKPVLLAVVVGVAGLLTAIAVARVLHLDPGYAGGLVSGALTQTPTMGTATEAIGALPLPEAERARLISHIAVAHAICFVFGIVGVVIMCSTIAPQLFRLDLKTAALELERSLGFVRETGTQSAWRPIEVRAFRVPEGAAIVGRTVAEAEASRAEQRLFVQRVRRGEALLESTPGLVLQVGDVIAVSGRRDTLVALLGAGAQEVEDRALLDIPVTIVDVLLTSREVAGRSLTEIDKQDWTRGVYLRGVRRGDAELPIAPGLVLERGDILRLSGAESILASVTGRIGTVIAPVTATDFIVLGVAIFLGGLLGVLATFNVGGLQISLSSSVGTLLAGLAVGHLRTVYPLFGRIPDGGVSLMTALGLAAFVAITGLQAGPTFVRSLVENGVGLFLGGMVVTLVPPLVGIAFGLYVLRMNPVLALGAVAGGQTVTAAMAAVQERSGSPVAVLGYTPAYPIANILLTIWGTVIVGIAASW